MSIHADPAVTQFRLDTAATLTTRAGPADSGWLVRPRMHHGGIGRVPVRSIKTTTISILALGLLAGSAVGVAAQDEEAAAGVTSVTGSIFGGEGLDVETTETEYPNGFYAVDGFTWRNDWVSSDERLTGDVTGVTNWVVGPDGFDAWGTGGQPDIIASQVLELTNDGGSWLGEGVSFGSTDLDISRDMFALVGQGGYEGLTAYVILEVPPGPPTFSGIIFPAAMPEAPEPYAGE